MTVSCLRPLIALLPGILSSHTLSETATWDVLDQRARALYEQARVADAELTMRQALELAERRYGTQDILSVAHGRAAQCKRS